MKETRIIQVKKFDKSLHYEWTSQLIDENKERILLYAGPGRTLQHHTRQACYTYESHALECFMCQNGFTVQLDLEEDGSIRYYCNIGLVPRLSDGVIEFIDLDLDFVAERGGEWRLVDEDEFVVNQIRYRYPESVVTHVWETIEEVRCRIKMETFPFDGSLERLLLKLAMGESSCSSST